MARTARAKLHRPCLDADLSHKALWLRVFELGGMSASHRVEASLCGGLQPSIYDDGVTVRARKRRFIALGSDHFVTHPDDADSVSAVDGAR